MTFLRIKIWIKYFLKSFIWLILPLCIFGGIHSAQSYINAGEHLSSYSIKVRSYTRKDGTRVKAYSRRPSGSVEHDSPYKTRRTFMAFIFIICLIGSTGSILFFIVFISDANYNY